MTRFEGLVWRHVPVGAEPLHLGWILKGARGRWNTRRPRLPCLYTSLSTEGARAEFEKQWARFRGPTERDLVSLRVDVSPVLDLTSRAGRQLARITVRTMTSDAERDRVSCRAVARRFVLQGDYCAILAPSAARAGAVNLMIYVAKTEGIRKIMNGPDRVRIGIGES